MSNPDWNLLVVEFEPGTEAKFIESLKLDAADYDGVVSVTPAYHDGFGRTIYDTANATHNHPLAEGT